MVKKTTDKVEKIKQKLEETTHQLKRALADYHNLERRVSEERATLGKFATGIIILKFLPVLDNLKKAAEHIKDDGLNLVVRQFEEILASEGVKEIPTLGQNFNPEIHEAVEVVQGEEDNKITKVSEAGYLLNDKTLRPAKVTVTKKTLNQEAEEKAEEASQFGDYA